MTLDTLKRAKVGETVEIPLYDSVNATRWVLKPKKVSVLLFENFLGLFGTGKLLNLFPKNCTLLTASRKLIALPKNRTEQSWQILGLNIMSFSPMHSTYFALLLKQAHRLMILVWFDQPSDHTMLTKVYYHWIKTNCTKARHKNP